MDFSRVSSSESQGQVGNVETGADGLPERVFTLKPQNQFEPATKGQLLETWP